MKKIYLLPVLAMLFVFSANAQTLSQPLVAPKKCATAELLQKFINTHPGAETTQQFESWMNAKVAEVQANRIAGRINPGVVLPVVFHIIHNSEAVGTGRNISAAAIQQQVLQINKDYANMSNSIYGPVAEDMGIQFGLAQKDPNGVVLTEPGIDRIDRVDKGWTAPPYTVGYASSSNYLINTIKPNSIWDPTRYLNIWVSEWEAGILGIATFPTSSGLPGLGGGETNATAGVTIDYTTVGSIFAPANSCTSPYGKGKTLTHELGHFFGLRHIWGDGTCATDYCSDTPVHAEANSGEPQHPKPNSCGTLDEMFENYMDYSDDIVTNTFTVNQGDRMEAVFANSPRRATLATSDAGLVMVNGTNRIAFADCDGSLVVSETSPLNTCPKYKDLSIMLNVEDKATATTTVTINTGGTATSGVHYQLLTPFVTFNAGDDFKALTVRIFDDGVAQTNRTILLSYSIGAGGGVSAGVLGQSLTISIQEDDVIRPVNEVSASFTTFSENFGTTPNNGNAPTGWLTGTFAASTNVFTVNAQYGAATGFTAADGRALHITDGTPAQRSAETATNTYTNTATSQPVCITRSISTVGLRNVKLSFDYAAEGEADYDYGYLLYTVSAQNSGFFYITDALGDPIVLQTTPGKTHLEISLPATLENRSNLWIGFGWNNDDNTGDNPPLIVDNIMVFGDQAVGVETAAGQSVTSSLGTSQTAQFISGNNKIIAAISNPNANIGCAVATVASSGNGQTAVTTNSGAFLRSNKVITLIPANANTTVSYTATFYFTTAELAAWGTEVPNLKLMKVQDGVSLGSVLNGTNTQIVTATVDDQRATKGYAAFTGNFSDGFSQFMLVSPLAVVPVSLLDFVAAPNGKSIQLNWSTSNEINSKGFVIERSTDGNHFEEIGWTESIAGNAASKQYQYPDHFVQSGVVYYYRLRQRDIDNRETLSDIRQAKIKGADFSILVSPNPAKNIVTVFAASGSSAAAQVTLLDARGAAVKQWKKLNISAAPALLNLSNVAPGVYMLQVIQDGKTSVEKLIIN